MTEEREGDWIQTYSGILFWPLDPRPEEISIADISHALSMQCRYGGHCLEFYSVAEHSVRVSLAVPGEFALWGLMHDAAEAYLVDLPRPIKRYSEMGRLYREIETRLMKCICRKFGLPEEEPAEVKRADMVLLMTEKRDLMTVAPKEWKVTEDPLPEIIEPWDHIMADMRFFNRFLELSVGKG